VAGFAEGLEPGAPVLDYCAGGGGKALALAALGHPVTAHDADPGRMRDLPARAARAGTPVALDTAPRGQWPAVLADVPCSGSGSWRRAPEGKWALTPARLDQLVALQGTILDRAAALVAPGGRLGHATCSLLDVENGAVVAGFLARRPGWRLLQARSWTPLEGGDGFHLSVLAAPS
jgi:16S rRNA (cytosine967-C5)-methyltransferase